MGRAVLAIGMVGIGGVLIRCWGGGGGGRGGGGVPFAVVRQVFGASGARSFVAFHVVGRFVVRRVAGAKNGVSVAHVALVPSVQAIVFVPAVGGEVGHVRRLGEDGTEGGVLVCSLSGENFIEGGQWKLPSS